MTAPHLASLWIYPIKALDGVRVDAARIVPPGALENDRRFGIFDKDGKPINGKRDARVHRLRCIFDASLAGVTISERHFDLAGGRAALESWLSGYFGQPVEVCENPDGGFPDDTDSPGPTLLSEATLAEVSSWFPGVAPGEMRARLRPNLVIAGVPAFWEDRLYGSAGAVVPFRLGGVLMQGVNPCQRCVVPRRDPLTGDSLPGFQRTFAERREQTLPPWADRSRFNHFYRLSVNTRVPLSEAGKLLRSGEDAGCDII